jgi:tetratricopeptide (TPR) repeat protein
MVRVFILLLFPLFIPFASQSSAQDDEVNKIWPKFSELYHSGDLINSEALLLSVFESGHELSDLNKISIYNNLGVINMMEGRYSISLDYYSKAEKIILMNYRSTSELASVYVNKAILLNITRTYDLAIEYFEKSIRIYNELNTNNDKVILQNLSTAYLNIGIPYYELKEYKIALDYLEKSEKLKSENHLPGLPLVYLNLAKTFANTGEVNDAEKYFQKSISGFTGEFGKDYYRLADAYFDFGLYLRSIGRFDESLDAHRKALAICLKNFGPKHTLVSLAYKHIGDYYFSQNVADSSLFYYQRSLIAVVKDFNNSDIFENPSIDSAIFNIRLLGNLKSKARALDLYSSRQKDPATRLATELAGLKTIDLAIQLIDRIRNKYLTEESRIYLAENEKETYMFAVQLAHRLYEISGERSYIKRMYDVAGKAKAAVLRNEISENELSYTAGIPDSLRIRRDQLSGNIAAYNNLILEELKKKDPDTNKINFWKDALFDFNRKIEKVADLINKEYPRYSELLQKTVPLPSGEIQKRLDPNEAVLDYMLSNQYESGKRKLYTFILTRNKLEFLESNLDSSFAENIAVVRRQNLPDLSPVVSLAIFRGYTSALTYFYENLVKPAEPFLKEKRLIIIPDEEIGLIPFDALLKEKPGPGQTDFDGLHFLVQDYALSFRYASSLIGINPAISGSGKEVYAFLPDYTRERGRKETMKELAGAGKEIDGVMKRFPGKKYAGLMATKANFKAVLGQPVVFHLAMHSLSDSTDSRYSYLMFDRGNDSLDNGRLYNYEISLSRISSPMVVLSACNSGTGVLYHGEGIMSLARGFILAGASSVIKTSWEVNDETSSRIITAFYRYLSKGMTKDEAMQHAKLDYIKSTPPSYNKPYYWAAYEVLGDNSGLIKKHNVGIIILIPALIGATILILIYLRRRRISFDRSL